MLTRPCFQTRPAHRPAGQARDFLQWIGERGIVDIHQMGTEHAAAYVELLTRSGREAASVKQALAALRMLFWALLASGKTTLREVDGWQSLTHLQGELDLAA